MVNCCVFNCPSNQFKKRGITFHPFPSEEDLRQQWLKNISRPQWQPPDSSRVCSLHFKVDSYRKGFKYKVLHMDAMPTLFPPMLYPGAVQNKPIKPPKSQTSGSKKAKSSPLLTGHINVTRHNGTMPFDLPIGGATNCAGVPNPRGRKLSSVRSRGTRGLVSTRPPRKRKQQQLLVSGQSINSQQAKQFAHPGHPLLTPPIGMHLVPGHPFTASTDHPHNAGHHPHDPSQHPHAIGHLLGAVSQHESHPHHHQPQHDCRSSSSVTANIPDLGIVQSSVSAGLTRDSLGQASQSLVTTPAPPAANYDAVEDHINTIKEENEIAVLKKKLKNKYALVRRRDKTIVELASQLSSMERKCANAVAQTPIAAASNTTAAAPPTIPANSAGNSAALTAFGALASAHQSGDTCARFLMEQVEAFASRERHQWSDFALEHCAIWHLKSPDAYSYVKDAGLLRLPSRDTLILCTGVGELAMPETPGGAGSGATGDTMFADKLAAAVLL